MKTRFSWVFGGIIVHWRALAIAMLAVATSGRSAELTETFAAAPSATGWRIAGDTSLFAWNASQQGLDVTWNSARSNSFCYLPLNTVLTKSDDFQLTFMLRVQDIQVGTTPGKPAEFPIAIGFLNRQILTNGNAYRGAGVSGLYGVRNILEWDFFPDAGFGDTWATTVVSSNNVFAVAHNFPVPLLTGGSYRVTLTYTASNEVVKTSAWRDGQSVGSLESISLREAPDFRLDVVSFTSYSDLVQTGAPEYHGSILAHGTIDEIGLTLPTHPAERIQLEFQEGHALVTFLSRTNWMYRLERSSDLATWQTAAPPIAGDGHDRSIRDTNSVGAARTPHAFYRIRCDRQ